MKITADNSSSLLILDYKNVKVKINFFATPKNFVLEKSDDKYFLAIKKNIQCLAFIDGMNFVLEFQKETEYSRLISFNIEYDVLFVYSSTSIEFGISDKNFAITVKNGTLEIDDEGNVLLSLNDKNSIVNISEKSTYSDIKSFTIDEASTSITDGSYMPEFSIACFDDSNFTFPRQVRYGKPVISTVPANISSLSPQADIDFYNNGKGPNSKTIYFRIICNKIIESLSSGSLSELRLKVYMPNGLDTVKSAEYVNMYFVSSDSTNNISIYKAQYDFYVQGNFNGIDYVDGLMYFDVHVPLTVQSFMPIQFDFSL